MLISLAIAQFTRLAPPYTCTSVHNLQPSCRSQKIQGLVNPWERSEVLLLLLPSPSWKETQKNNKKKKVRKIFWTEGDAGPLFPNWIQYSTAGQHSALPRAGWNTLALKDAYYCMRVAIPCRGHEGRTHQPTKLLQINRNMQPPLTLNSPNMLHCFFQKSVQNETSLNSGTLSDLKCRPSIQIKNLCWCEYPSFQILLLHTPCKLQHPHVSREKPKLTILPDSCII